MKCPECQFDNREGVRFREKSFVRTELMRPARGGYDLSVQAMGTWTINLTWNSIVL